MSITTKQSEALKQLIKDEAKALDFNLCFFTNADKDDEVAKNLKTYVDLGHHGTMDWMVETYERRTDPKVLWGDAKSIIMLGVNYGPAHDPREVLKHPDKGAISVYAQNRDYHDLIKGKLKTLASKLAARCRHMNVEDPQVKVFVDTAPVMEKPLAARAGLGWQGKHTNLVSQEFGSWLFLGSIFTNVELPIDAPIPDHCGSCQSCLDHCPTNAFTAPYQIDAKRCISYLTIEHKEPIPREFRPLMGNRIYGCDDCLSACPWNKFAQTTNEIKLISREELIEPDLKFLVTLNDEEFRKFFSGSPVKRIGRDRFIRNVLTAIGNSANKDFIEIISNLLNDQAAVVRGAAIWAYSQLDLDGIKQKQQAYISEEKDPDVIIEWQALMEKK